MESIENRFGVADHQWLICWIAKYRHRHTGIYYFMHALTVTLAVRLLLRALIGMLLEVLLVRTIIVRLLLLMVKGGSLHSFLWLLLLILVVLMLPFIESSKDFPQSSWA